jgi:hypothetical protein
MKIRNGRKRFCLNVNDIEVEQRIDVFEALDKLSEICQPVRVIEIGTKFGGFTTILENHKLTTQSDIFTFDINQYRDYNFTKAQFNLKDCFEHEEYVANLIQEDGLTLLFCDGGNKIKEFNTFAKYLKDGDMIFAHDYIEDSITYNSKFKGKIWNAWETSLEPIAETIKNESLKDILPEYFSKAVWKSCIKNS